MKMDKSMSKKSTKMLSYDPLSNKKGIIIGLIKKNVKYDLILKDFTKQI